MFRNHEASRYTNRKDYSKGFVCKPNILERGLIQLTAVTTVPLFNLTGLSGEL
jgi:hypothetical protein